MATDSSKPMSGAPRPAWDLPEILDIKIRRVPFKPRVHKHFKSALADYKEAVEFLVRTSGPIPARALGPVLFVGDVQVTESEPVENNLYRFLALEIERLEPRAAISWGWEDAAAAQRYRTKFRYEVAGS